MYHFLTKKYDFVSRAKLFYDTNAIIFCRQEVVFHGYLHVTRFFVIRGRLLKYLYSRYSNVIYLPPFLRQRCTP